MIYQQMKNSLLWLIPTFLLLNFNICFADFHDHFGIYLKIPKNVCDKVVYVDQDDGSTGTVLVDQDGNYDLSSRHDYDHDNQGEYNKRRDYFCYSSGESHSFSFAEIKGYWQHVEIEDVRGGKAIDGRADILVDGYKIPCGNGDDTQHYWRVYWKGTFGPGGWSKCANTTVYCIDPGFWHVCSENGFVSGYPTNVNVPANWRNIYFQAIESGHAASTQTHYYLNMSITHVKTAPQPKLDESVLLISAPDSSKLYDANGVPLSPNTLKVISSENRLWYRVGLPKDGSSANLKLQVGLSKDAQDQIVQDGSYNCTATVESTNGSGIITKNIISGNQSYLDKTLSMEQPYNAYKFIDENNYQFSGDDKTIDLTLSVACENGKPGQDINFYPQYIRLYKVKHF